MSKRRYGWPPTRATIGDIVTCKRFWHDGRIGKVTAMYKTGDREWCVVDWKPLSHPGLLISHHIVDDLDVWQLEDVKTVDLR